MKRLRIISCGVLIANIVFTELFCMGNIEVQLLLVRALHHANTSKHFWSLSILVSAIPHMAELIMPGSDATSTREFISLML